MALGTITVTNGKSSPTQRIQILDPSVGPPPGVVVDDMGALNPGDSRTYGDGINTFVAGGYLVRAYMQSPPHSPAQNVTAADNTDAPVTL